MNQNLYLFLHSKTLKTFAASSYIIKVPKLQCDLESNFSQYLINKILPWKLFLLDLLIKIPQILRLGKTLLIIIQKGVCMCKDYTFCTKKM